MKASGTIQVIVAKIIRETNSVKRFVLISRDGAPLPSFGGGSHIPIKLGDGDRPIQRHYSLVNDGKRAEHYEIAVKLHPDSRGGSRYLHEAVREGQELSIGVPKNHFPLSFRAKRHVFYAAGIGITPFLSMMAELKRKGGSFELHYAAPSREQCAFYDDIQEHYGDAAAFYFSEGHSKRRMLPDGLKEQGIGTHVYFCGPESMIRQFSAQAERYGYPPGSIHFELFTARASRDPRPFQAVLQQSNLTVTVAQDETLLDAIHAAGVKLPYSCRVGGCGTCVVEAIEGEVEHNDFILSEQEKGAGRLMLPCVSRCSGDRIVLNC